MEQEVQAEERKRSRSPGYPAIPLDQALERANTLYAAERGHLTHIDAALRHWGYASRSGQGLVTVAALIQFGLMEDAGSGRNRRVRLSELAMRIVRDDRAESPDRDELVREAALRPSIHRELWDQYQGSLPSDDNLRYSLKIDKHFTDSGANAFIREFRRTIEFAKLTQSGDVSIARDDSGEYGIVREVSDSPRARVTDFVPDSSARVHMDTRTSPPRLWVDRPRVPRPTGRSLLLPILSSNEWPVLSLPETITEADWDQMLAVLLAMKPGIVSKPSPPEEPETQAEPIDE